MAKPVEKLTKTAILKRIYRVLELEYIGGRHHGVASADVESVARDGVVVMLTKEPVAEIRRLFYVELSRVGTIASELVLHHDTVRVSTLLAR